MESKGTNNVRASNPALRRITPLCLCLNQGKNSEVFCAVSARTLNALYSVLTTILDFTELRMADQGRDEPMENHGGASSSKAKAHHLYQIRLMADFGASIETTWSAARGSILAHDRTVILKDSGGAFSNNER